MKKNAESSRSQVMVSDLVIFDTSILIGFGGVMAWDQQGG
jgi:hypothetical protein